MPKLDPSRSFIPVRIAINPKAPVIGAAEVACTLV